MSILNHKSFLSALTNVTEYENYIAGDCPFEHHKSPALLVFADGWFRCLGCNRTGNWKMLWNKLQGQKIVVRPDKRTSWAVPNYAGDELETLCYQSHLDLMKFDSFQWYLKDRGIDGRIEENELGYYEGWYTVPVYDDNGEFVTAVFRSSPPLQEATGNRFVCKHVPVPFSPNWELVKRMDYLYVVFGLFDALTMAELQLPVVTSTSGKDTFNAEWLAPYRKPIIIIPDEDEEDTAFELAKNLGWRGQVLLMDYPDGKKDVNGFLEADKEAELRRQLERHRVQFEASRKYVRIAK